MNDGHSAPEVWLVDVDRTLAAALALEAARPHLSAADRERGEKLGAERERWLALRTILRVLLERHVGIAIRGAAFTIEAGGRPVIPWATDVHFSLSHSDAHALIAIARGPVGVDLEGARVVRFSEARDLAIRAAAIGAGGAALPDGDIRDAISTLQAWVRLEAWAKARGSGIGRLLSDLGIWGPRRVTDGLAGNLVRAGEVLRHDALDIVDLALPTGLHAALAQRHHHNHHAGGTIAVHQFPVTLPTILELERTQAPPVAPNFIAT